MSELDSISMPAANLPLARLCEDYLHSPAGRAMIEKQVTECCERAIKEATGYHSEFQKQLQATFVKTLQVPLDFDFVGYQQTIVNIMRAKLEHLSRDVVQQQLAAQMVELLEPAPESIKLSELVTKYVEELREEDADDCGCHYDADEKRVSVRFSDTDHNFLYVDLSKSAKAVARDKLHSGDIKLGFYKQELFSLRFKDISDETQLFVGRHYGFARLVFQMKAAKTKVIIDRDAVEDVELYYGKDHAD